MMRLKTDENLHPDVAQYLRANGHDAVTLLAESDVAGHLWIVDEQSVRMRGSDPA